MCGCAPVYYGRDYAGMIVHVAYGETMPVRRGVAKMLNLGETMPVSLTVVCVAYGVTMLVPSTIASLLWGDYVSTMSGDMISLDCSCYARPYVSCCLVAMHFYTNGIKINASFAFVILLDLYLL